MVNHLFLTRSSSNSVQQRPSLMRQNRLMSSTSDSNSTSNSKALSIAMNKIQGNIFDFDPMHSLNSFAIPESTISSIRPASEVSSTTRLRKFLSQSDLATSGDDIDTPRARSASLSDLQNDKITLLELSKAAKLNYVCLG